VIRVRLDYLLISLSIIVFAIVAVFYARKNRTNPRRTLTHIVAANIALDITAIAIWMFPAFQWSIYRLDFFAVGTEAAIAAALFALTLFGLIRNKKWAPILAIAVTAAQRVFATYIFFPSSALALTLIWSFMMVFFAFTELKTSKMQPEKI
jgi:hypothetical protein